MYQVKEELIRTGELPYWIAEYEVSPWGDYRADVREAIIGSYLGACWGGKAKPSQLIPKWDTPPSSEELELIRWQAWVAAHNARFNEGQCLQTR